MGNFFEDSYFQFFQTEDIALLVKLRLVFHKLRTNVRSENASSMMQISVIT